MKKILALTAVLIMIFVLCACSNASPAENKAAQTSKKTINDILAESQAKNSTAPPEVHFPKLDYTADIDLTKLNSNMVYSTVYSMVTGSGNYTGKTVKASGTFDVTTDIKTGKMFYACIIADATACCSQGLEFQWKGEHSYPDDYPEVGTLITVGGTFKTYEENGKTYCCLSDAEFAFE